MATPHAHPTRRATPDAHPTSFPKEEEHTPDAEGWARVGTCCRALAWNRRESLWAAGGVVGAALSGAVYPLLALLLALMMATFFICARGGDWCCPTPPLYRGTSLIRNSPPP